MKEEEKLAMINQQLKSLLEGEKDWLANLANAAALLFNELEEVNWAGFYLWREEQLILGPFQGLPACVRIDLGQGVCGSAARDRRIYIVPDVHQFPGHIACDTASNSEIVVPIIVEGKLLGVLDVDSPIKERFNEVTARYLEDFVAILVQGTNFPSNFNEGGDLNC